MDLCSVLWPVYNPHEGRHRPSGHPQADEQIQQLGRHQGRPGHQQRPATPRLQVPQVVRPRDKGQRHEQDVSREEGHVDVSDSGHLAAAVLALAAGGDLFESEGMGGQQRYHGDEEPEGVAPSPVPHHVAGSHNIPVLLCGDGPDVTVSSREEECYGCEGEVDHVEDQLLGAGHGGGQAQQHTHSHSPRQYAYNKCMKL